MFDSVFISVKFNVRIYEGGRLIKQAISSNKILRGGLNYLAQGGGINTLSKELIVGEDNMPTDFNQEYLNSPIANGIGEFYDQINPVNPYQIGFTNFYPLNKGVGTWKEIGILLNPSHLVDYRLFDRAVFTEPVEKSNTQTAFVGAVFTIARGLQDGED